MTGKTTRTVANPPRQPLMIFDGTCHFCRRWIERWKQSTNGRVDYQPSQEIAPAFPEVSAADFDRAVQFIETDGRVVSGAEAVFGALRYARGAKWLARCYERVPAFALVTEGAYAV